MNTRKVTITLEVSSKLTDAALLAYFQEQIPDNDGNMMRGRFSNYGKVDKVRVTVRPKGQGNPSLSDLTDVMDITELGTLHALVSATDGATDEPSTLAILEHIKRAGQSLCSPGYSFDTPIKNGRKRLGFKS